MSDAASRTEWPFVELDVDSVDAELVSASLLDLGSTGVEERPADDGRATIVAWFAATPDLAELAAALASARTLDADVARAAASTLRAGSTPDDDWLKLWKRGFEPTPVGSRLLVFPSWKRVEAMAIPHKTAPFTELSRVVALPPPKEVSSGAGYDSGERRRRRRG